MNGWRRSRSRRGHDPHPAPLTAREDRLLRGLAEQLTIDDPRLERMLSRPGLWRRGRTGLLAALALIGLVACLLGAALSQILIFTGGSIAAVAGVMGCAANGWQAFTTRIRKGRRTSP